MNGGCRTRKKLQRTRVIHIPPRFVWASFVSRIALGETEDSSESLGFRKNEIHPAISAFESLLYADGRRFPFSPTASPSRRIYIVSKKVGQRNARL